ncbi:MAG: hypothetical protein LIO77_00200 [Rikenellaceae bacterium]|nr:hypothetical protein [Rikenellaceae bacterium]
MKPEKFSMRPGPAILNLSLQRIVVGIVLGLTLALVIYCLMYYYRELLRVIWTDPCYDILVLPPREMNFYNVICAYICAIFGQSLCFTFWLQRPVQEASTAGRRARRIVGDLWPLNFVFLGLLTGFFCEIGLVMFWRTEAEFGLYPDYNIYFILAIVVLFFRPWLNICRIFKRRGLKWMAVSAVVISIFSFGISRINNDYQAFNEKFLDRSVYHNYMIDWPFVAQPSRERDFSNNIGR